VLAVDRAYIDFKWLHNLDSTGVVFVSKLKKNISYQIVKEHPINEKNKDLLNDYEIKVTGIETSKAYPKRLRMVHVYDEKNDKYLLLLINQFSWTANTVSQVYRVR